MTGAFIYFMVCGLAIGGVFGSLWGYNRGYGDHEAGRAPSFRIIVKKRR